MNRPNAGSRPIKPQRPQLQLIEGGLSRQFNFNGISLRISPQERKLPAVEAYVVEQDTALLLDESLQLRLDHETIGQLTSSLQEEDFDLPLASIVPRRGQPMQLDVVIHDLMMEPNWTHEVLEAALDELFALLPAMAIHSLAMPALAHRHGKLPVNDFISLLCGYLQQHRPTWEGELWLLLPHNSIKAALVQLESLCKSPPP